MYYYKGCSKQSKMYTHHEETDTRMLLYAFNAMDDCPKVTLESPDTDVAVLCVYYFEHLTKYSELYFCTDTADKRRLIPIIKYPELSGLHWQVSCYHFMH